MFHTSALLGLEASDGLVEAFGPAEGHALVVERLVVVLLQLEGLVVGPDGLAELPRVVKSVAAAVPGHLVLGVELDGLVEAEGGGLELAHGH
jgi:hypothetical protein